MKCGYKVIQLDLQPPNRLHAFPPITGQPTVEGLMEALSKMKLKDGRNLDSQMTEDEDENDLDEQSYTYPHPPKTQI